MIFCDKCEREITEVNGELVDGKCLKFKDGEYEYFVNRCNECYERNQSLSNYKKCEVYSRVVGYMRPTSQWNKGKQKEYEDRKEFKNPD